MGVIVGEPKKSKIRMTSTLLMISCSVLLLLAIHLNTVAVTTNNSPTSPILENYGNSFNRNGGMQLSSNIIQSVVASPPPEPLDTIDFCAEKCKHVPEMCTENLYRDRLSLPAPSCLRYSTTIEDDVYWQNWNSRLQKGVGIYKERHERTNQLISWATTTNARSSSRRSGKFCEQANTTFPSPMMFPEEFEFVTKLMINARPKTYLEWGCGASTSFYPLLATKTVVAIDGYPPWCEQVAKEPRVKCMKDEGKLHFFCPELVGSGGHPVSMAGAYGLLSPKISDADLHSMLDIYVNSLDTSMAGTGVTKFDVALVDGRFRLQCALKLLPHLNSESVLLMHDFWVRINDYKDVLKYYYVIGYARSVVALRKIELGLSKDDELNVYIKYMNRQSVTRDIEQRANFL